MDTEEYLLTLKSKIVKKIKIVMNQNNISQADFCKKHDISEPYFSRIINQKTIPTLDRLLELADKVNLRIDAMLFNVDNVDNQ